MYLKHDEAGGDGGATGVVEDTAAGEGEASREMGEMVMDMEVSVRSEKTTPCELTGGSTGISFYNRHCN